MRLTGWGTQPSGGVGFDLILKLIGRFPIIVYIGAGAIAITAGRMFAHDHLLAGVFTGREALLYVLDAVLVLGICGGGWLANRRRTLAHRPG